jgi:hypothetical protein
LFLLSQAARVGSDTYLSIWSGQSALVSLSVHETIGIYWAIIGLTLLLAIARSFIFVNNVALSSSRRIHSIAFGLLMRASVPLFFDVTVSGLHTQHKIGHPPWFQSDGG